MAEGRPEGTVVLHETFDRNELDDSKWEYAVTCWGGGNGEFQMYTPEPENTYIKNGILHLKPTFTADKFGEEFLRSGTLNVEEKWGRCTHVDESGDHRYGRDIPPIMSSRLTTKAAISHGRVEVVAQLPKGDWLWPAIWMLPNGLPGNYGTWPRSGEIDIVEARGNLDLQDYQGHPLGLNVVYSTIHMGPDFHLRQMAGHWKINTSGTWGDTFHTYAVDRTEGHIRMEVDDQIIFNSKTPYKGYWQGYHFQGDNIWANGGLDAPFDKKFSLILNVAVGGGYFQEEWTNAGYPQPWKRNTSSSDQMVDFWDCRDKWGPTWNGEDAAMKIKSVKMIQY